jgi:hypothetical protein
MTRGFFTYDENGRRVVTVTIHSCTCGHDRNYHGNADGQTGWQARCGHPACDCDDFGGVA